MRNSSTWGEGGSSVGEDFDADGSVTEETAEDFDEERVKSEVVEEFNKFFMPYSAECTADVSRNH